MNATNRTLEELKRLVLGDETAIVYAVFLRPLTDDEQPVFVDVVGGSAAQRAALEKKYSRRRRPEPGT